MPFEPLSLPYWTVPAWNPDVNEARANGEYPTAEWANQLQALHNAEIAKINEAGALADSVTSAVGVVGGTHIPGTILIAGEDGSFKALPPGTLNQVLSPNSNLADGISWKTMLPVSPVKGDMVAFDGTNWIVIRVNTGSHGWFLRRDDFSPTGVSWASSVDATATTISGVEATKTSQSPRYWDNSAGSWGAVKRLDGIATISCAVVTARGGVYTSIPNGALTTFGVAPPIIRPSAPRAGGSINTYKASDGTPTDAAPLSVNVNGTITAQFPASGGPFSIRSSGTAGELTFTVSYSAT